MLPDSPLVRSREWIALPRGKTLPRRRAGERENDRRGDRQGKGAFIELPFIDETSLRLNST